MKKVPMIILLLAPYVFLFICIGICMAEKGFTADAIEMIGWTFMGMFLLILFPNMIYAFILKTMRIRVSKVILLEYADQTMQYSNLCVGVRSRCFCCQHDPWNYADSLFGYF